MVPGNFQRPDSISDPMPERSFGRTIRYRRNKLGLSQAKLGELVGRSATAVRAWERDKSYPTDTTVITALSAILGVDERILFERVGQEPPAVETSPTIEQALATLGPEVSEAPEDAGLPESGTVDEVEAQAEPSVEPDSSGPEPDPQPAYTAPTGTYVLTAQTPVVADRSYMEDSSQRQLYRIRNLAAIVALVALGIAFLWALSEGLGALGDWWDDFFGTLKL